jgi:hypothetical protein
MNLVLPLSILGLQHLVVEIGRFLELLLPLLPALPLLLPRLPVLDGRLVMPAASGVPLLLESGAMPPLLSQLSNGKFVKKKTCGLSASSWFAQW